MRRTKNLLPIRNPELIFGLVGPIGVDLDLVIEALNSSLQQVKYETRLVHLTKLMRTKKVSLKIDESTYVRKYLSLIKYANAYRKAAGHAEALAARAILEIGKIRTQFTNDERSPALGTAFIIRQFKRPEEIELMRKTYGRKFIQVSVYGSATDRKRVIREKIRKHSPAQKPDIEVEQEAAELVDVDHNQKNEFGQRISDVFHLGDVFVKGIDKSEIGSTVSRFVNALFGHNGISPNRDEYGLYAASGAALRSIDLSRQVGAAIFTNQGEVVSLGCNEVPKAGGGTYWSDNSRAFRDFELGQDANQSRKSEILYEFATILADENMFSRTLSKLPPDARFLQLSKNRKVKKSQLMDIIEFGRMIHAEMSAISDAARLGRSTRNAILFCTTFPCHICAKHIVASGISRVVFLEPYPKSYAERLHSDSITFEQNEDGKVLFQPFIGISPRRYRDIFEKKSRKDQLNGKAANWYLGVPAPMIEDTSAAYIANEEAAGSFLLGIRASQRSRR